MRNFVLGLAAIGLLGGCASVTGGTSQTIYVNTTPADASCDFLREGQTIGSIPSTPGQVVVRRLKLDITINCSKEGYQDASFYNNSGLSSAVGANIAVDVLLTAGLSSIIDSANGADNEYQDTVNITLTPLPDSAK